MLKGWDKSDGANAEYLYAKKCGKEIIPNDYEISVMKIEDVEQIRDKIIEYIEMVKGSDNDVRQD